MTSYTQLSSLYLRLINRKGEADITDNIKVNSVSRFNLLAWLNHNFTVSAQDISYQMGMYAPDHFTAEIVVSLDGNAAMTDENNEPLTLTKVAEALMGLRAEVRYTDPYGADRALSLNLFVYQAIPSIDRNAGTQAVNIRLEIYSNDKLLELQKFSQAYTGLPLGKVITKENLAAFIPKDSNQNPKYDLTVAENKKLQMLGFKIQNASGTSEVIQPYMAQYNETFRDMLNRTANRCGEFLYWRNGELQYGLCDDGSREGVDNDAAKVTVPVLPTDMFEALNVTDNHRNGNEKAEVKVTDGVAGIADSANTVRYDLETGMPDYNGTVSFAYGKTRKYDYKRMMDMGFGKRFYTDTSDVKNYGKVNPAKSDAMKYVLGTFLSSYAKAGGLWEFISDIAVDTLVTKPLVNRELEKFRDLIKQLSHNKRFYSANPGDMAGFDLVTQTNFSRDINKKGEFTKKPGNAAGYDELERDNKIAPFSTLKDIISSDCDFLKSDVLGNLFYSKVRALGKLAGQNAVDIVLMPTAKPLNVGQCITLNGVAYVVTSISGSCGQNATASKDIVVTSQKVHAIPMSKATSNKTCFLPEPLPVQTRQMEGTCTAYITDIEDPYEQGRVRVRFTWQGAHPSVGSPKVATVQEDSTPWIRRALPSAGKALMYMEPCIGDEVVVGFENGNLERPYVIGSVLNKSVPIPRTAPVTTSDTGSYYIEMPNGESFSMVDEAISGADIISTFLTPLPNSILKLTDPDYSLDVHKLKYKVGGKIEMKDKYGFYNLSMSSAERTVKIASPMGNVSLSAFTGITISAPNGDINIKGKNVNITAGDKLTLTSGTNKELMTNPSGIVGTLVNTVFTAGIAAVNVVMGDTRLLDLGMARSIMEVVVRPINGTLSLHSYHHLLIEAGYGNVEMPMDAVVAKNPKGALNMFPNYPYYLLENFVKGVEGDFQNGVVALQNVYDWIRNYDTRPNNSDFDAGAIDMPYVEWINKNGDISMSLYTILSESKFNQVLQSGTKKQGKIWVVDDSEKTINQFCPVPKKYRSYNYKVWVAEVKKVAQKVADLQNIYEAIVNKKIVDMPAFETFVEVMNATIYKDSTGIGSLLSAVKHKLKDSDFAELDNFTTSVRYDERESKGCRNEIFCIDKYTGSGADIENYKPIVFTGTFTQNYTHLIQYIIIKILYKFDLVKIIDPQETVELSKNEYGLCKLPKWDDEKGFPEDFKSWEDFLMHCAPATSVKEKSKLSAVGDVVKDIAVGNADLITNALGGDYMNINAMFNNERKVWDTNAHRGLILMSSEYGSSTTVVDGSGQVSATNNHSVYSVLNNIKVQETIPDVANGGISESVRSMYEANWTQTFNI